MELYCHRGWMLTTLTVTELTEHQRKELIPAGEMLDILVTIVLASKVIEVISVKECYQLGENELIFEHTQPCIWLQSYEFKSVDSRNCS